jgi:acyl-CoA dehydrogenase
MSDMQAELDTLIDRISADHVTQALHLHVEQGGWPSDLWTALEQSGVPQACVASEQGGADLPFADAMTALRRSAYHGLPVPLAESMLATRLLRAAGLPVPPGVLTVQACHAQDDLQIQGDGETWWLQGHAHRVPWLTHAHHWVVTAQHEGRDCVAVLERSAWSEMSATTRHNLAGEPRTQMELQRAAVLHMAPLSDAGERLLLEGALMRSVQMAGALQRALDNSIQYANERVQFGRPIGKFQAVQHMLAVLAGHVAASSAAVDAVVGASQEMPHALLTAIAKARVGEAASKGTEIAHQVHGAMGFTREHHLHHVTRRLWAWRDEFGNESIWQTRLGRWVTQHGADQLWPLLTSL